jgi:hypothetical protein
MCRVDIKGHKLAYNTLLEMRAKSNTILRISCPNAPACDETMIYEDMMRHVIVCSNKPAPTPVVIQNGANNDDIINNESVSDYTFVYNSLPVYLDDTPMHFPNFFNIGEQIMNILTDSAHLMHALLHFPIPFNIDESVVMESIDLNVDDYIMNILTDSIHVLHNLGLPQMENTDALIRLIHRHGNGRREREPHIISMSMQHNMLDEPSSVHSNQTSPRLYYADTSIHFPIPFNIDESVVMESIDLNLDDYIMNILTNSIHVLSNLGLPQMANTDALIRLIHRHGNGRREREPRIISMSIQHNMINEPSSVHSNQTSPSLDYVD